MPAPPGPYVWLNEEPGPRMLLEGLKTYGVHEGIGNVGNPQVIAWADEVQRVHPTPYNRWADAWYDSATKKPWCGLWMAVITVRANVDKRADRWPPDKYLSAAAWANYGVPVDKARPLFGDVGVFSRDGGNHVGIIIGRSPGWLHVLGGNTSNRVTAGRIATSRLTHVRRTPYLNMPANVTDRLLPESGAVTTNEA